MSRKKQNFLQGALILSAAAIIVKVIGALYKIPLMNIFGGEGFGYYNTAYQIFTPLYTIATAGIPIAVARMVSECVTMGRYRDVRRIFQISMTCFVVTGTVGSVIMLFGKRKTAALMAAGRPCLAVLFGKRNFSAIIRAPIRLCNICIILPKSRESRFLPCCWSR